MPRLFGLVALGSLLAGCVYYYPPPPTPVYAYVPCAPPSPPPAAGTLPLPPNAPSPGGEAPQPGGEAQCVVPVGGYYPAYPYPYAYPASPPY